MEKDLVLQRQWIWTACVSVWGRRLRRVEVKGVEVNERWVSETPRLSFSLWFSLSAPAVILFYKSAIQSALSTLKHTHRAVGRPICVLRQSALSLWLHWAQFTTKCVCVYSSTLQLPDINHIPMVWWPKKMNNIVAVQWKWWISKKKLWVSSFHLRKSFRKLFK